MEHIVFQIVQPNEYLHYIYIKVVLSWNQSRDLFSSGDIQCLLAIRLFAVKQIYEYCDYILHYCINIKGSCMLVYMFINSD